MEIEITTGSEGKRILEGLRKIRDKLMQDAQRAAEEGGSVDRTVRTVRKTKRTTVITTANFSLYQTLKEIRELDRYVNLLQLALNEEQEPEADPKLPWWLKARFTEEQPKKLDEKETEETQKPDESEDEEWLRKLGLPPRQEPNK